ncbi:MAG TPA: hypothetical protein VKV28_12725 [Candidatus Binataceae bacterium]|nr:hypothetical protein [Candidatus Binataceae bacterium]
MGSRDLNYWLELAVRRHLIIIEVAGTVFGVVLLITVLWPPVYASRAEILVQRNRAQLLVSPDLGGADQAKQEIVSTPVSEEELNSERELLSSPYLVRKAIEGVSPPVSHHRLGAGMIGAVRMLLGLPGLGYRVLHGTPQVTAQDRLVRQLSAHLGVSVIKRSNVIELSFRSDDALWCQEFLERLISAYFELRGQLSNDPQAEQFFQTQAALLQRKLRQSEDQLRGYELQSGISNLNSQQQALITQASDLGLEHSKAVADLASAQQEVQTLTMQLKGTAERINKETRSEQNMALQNLKPQVLALKTERADLLSRYQPGSERIREIDAKLKAAQSILNHENHLEVSESSTDLNPVWVMLDSNLAQAKTRAASLAATVQKLAQEIDQVHGQLDQTVTNGVELVRLQRQVDTDREAYLSYVRKAEEARAAGALNSDKILNVSVAEAPILPLRPVFPKLWLNLMAGLLMALVLALAAAEWEEQRDPRIYSSAAIARDSGLKTFTVLHSEF